MHVYRPGIARRSSMLLFLGEALAFCEIIFFRDLVGWCRVNVNNLGDRSHACACVRLGCSYLLVINRKVDGLEWSGFLFIVFTTTLVVNVIADMFIHRF